jgi:thermitase
MNKFFASLTIKQRYLLIIAVITVLAIFLNVIISSNSQTQPAADNTQIPTTPAPPSSPPERVSGQILVKFKQGIPQATIRQELQKHNASIINTNTAIRVSTISVPEGQEDAVIKALQDSGLIEYAESNLIHHYRFAPNDPSFGTQWHLEKIQAPQAWDITKGTGVKVAIIDSGVDSAHEDIASQLGGTSPANLTDSDGHGTHVSGIAAAATNNAKGVAGACPECKLLVAEDGGNDGTSATSITWAADQGAKVISMSWGNSTASQALQDAVNYAWTKGALPVAAVPNTDTNMDNTEDFPSGMANVLSVTNTDNSDKRISAGFGATKVWMAAPGENILSTLPGNTYGNNSGTSMSTPLVAGVAGLVWSTSHGTSPDAVRQRLCDTADKITGTGTEFKCGRLNAFKAVQAAAGVSPGVVSPPIVQPTFVCGGSTNSICPPPSGTVPPVSATGMPNPLPSTSLPSTAPSESVPLPSASPQDPCAAGTSLADQRHKKNKHKKNKGGVSKSMEQLIEFLIELINKLIALFGGSPLPTNPDVDPENPNEQPENPDEEPQNPSGMPENPVPSPVPC